MDISKTNASSALDDIEAAQDRVRTRVLYRGTDVLYLIWGVIWFVAFLFQQFAPKFHAELGSLSFDGSGVIWAPLVLTGIILSLLLTRKQEIIRQDRGKRYGLVWLVIFGYFYLWIFLLGPLFNHQLIMTEEGMRHMTALISTVPMSIYVVMGLMGAGVWMSWLGVSVTLVTAVGLVLVPDYFYLWMAIFGGGALCLAGVLSNRRWKTA